LAVAAITASVLFAKTRQTPGAEVDKPEMLHDVASLEALRAAGF
jgi:hypothetical protein